VSISGIAGPDGGSEEKPVGTVWFAFATARGEGITRRECFSGDRDAVRRQATAYALQTLWQQQTRRCRQASLHCRHPARRYH
ncbi:CinA family protein, partial [Escherichia sp. R-CC3]